MNRSNIYNVQEWELMSHNVNIPLNRTMRLNQMGEPIDIVSRNNGFKPECIYQDKEGNKIVYVFDECTPKLINMYAIYMCR